MRKTVLAALIVSASMLTAPLFAQDAGASTKTATDTSATAPAKGTAASHETHKTHKAKHSGHKAGAKTEASNEAAPAKTEAKTDTAPTSGQ